MSEHIPVGDELWAALVGASKAALPSTGQGLTNRGLTEEHHHWIDMLTKVCDELLCDGRKIESGVNDDELQERLFGPLVHTWVMQEINMMHGKTGREIKPSDVLAYCSQVREKMQEVVLGKTTIEMDLR